MARNQTLESPLERVQTHNVRSNQSQLIQALPLFDIIIRSKFQEIVFQHDIESVEAQFKRYSKEKVIYDCL